MRRSPTPIAIPIAMAMLASSCVVGPNYEAPAITPPSSFVSQGVLTDLNADKDGEIPAEWWEGFNDPLLNELVEAGLSSNQRLASAAARLEAAEARLREADAENAPRLEAEAGPSIRQEQQFDPEMDATNTRSIFGALGLVVPLDVFGKNARQTEAESASIDASKQEIRNLVLEISAEIVSEYLALRGNQRQLELLQESVDLQEKTLSIVQARFETGLSPELDVRRAETSVQRLYADIPPLERRLQDSRNRLATLAGEYPGLYEERLTPFQDAPQYSAPIPESIPLDVLRRRPDVRQAEAQLRRAVAAIGIEEADLYPSFDLTADLRLSSTVTGSNPGVDLLAGSIGGLINQTLLDGGARRAQITIAEAQAREALADYRLELLNAAEEVETVLAQIRASQQTQAALEKAVNSSQRSFEQAETLYQQGLISFLDVVDAQRVLADAEQELAAERTDFATQLAALFRALGTETEPREITREDLPVVQKDNESSTQPD